MTLYEQFEKKQNEIFQLINQQEIAEEELNNIRRQIYVKHKERFEQKRSGKTSILDDGYEVTFERREKISVHGITVKREGFKSPCLVEKVTPEKREIKLSKTIYNKLSDCEREKVDKYLHKEQGKPMLRVRRVEDN